MNRVTCLKILSQFLLFTLIFTGSAICQNSYQLTIRQNLTAHVDDEEQENTTVDFAGGDKLKSNADVEIKNTSDKDTWVQVLIVFSEVKDDGTLGDAKSAFNPGWKKVEPGKSIRYKIDQAKVEYDTSNGAAAKYKVGGIINIGSEKEKNDHGQTGLQQNIYNRDDVIPGASMNLGIN